MKIASGEQAFHTYKMVGNYPAYYYNWRCRFCHHGRV